MLDSMVPEFLYPRYSNRQLAAIPLSLLAISILIIAGTWITTGMPVNPGIDFTGGTELQIETDAPESEIEAAFEGPLPAGDLGGLKRRTRCMMGRCQGFYCSAEVMTMVQSRLAS